MSDELKIKFWGVRGSHPAPGAQTVRYGGNTSSVEIRAGDRTILLDAGTGIIPLGYELARTKRMGELLLLLSHLHHDHIEGFPFFTPAYMPNARLHILGPGGTPESLRRVLEYNQSSETFPVSLHDMPSAKDIQSLRESQVIVWDEQGIHVTEPAISLPEQNASEAEELNDEAVIIQIHRSYAHPGGVYIYRIAWHGKSVVYATDTEGYVGTDHKLVEFARGADVLIHDAQYLEEHYRGRLAGFPSTQGFGHSTVRMASEVAAAAEVGQLVLFHHEPSYSDAIITGMETFAKARFGEVHAAYEGFEIDLAQDSTRFAPLLPLSVKERDVKYASHD